MSSPQGGQVGPGGPCLLGLARARLGRICSKQNLERNPGRGLGTPVRSESCNHPSDGTPPAQRSQEYARRMSAVQAAQAPGRAPSWPRSQRPSLARAAGGSRPRWLPRPLRPHEVDALPMPVKFGLWRLDGGGRRASRRLRGSRAPNERPTVGVRLRSRMRTCLRPSPACSR
jgi:hypothetical protein